MSNYELRGSRVEKLEAYKIELLALAISKEFKFNKRTRKKCDVGFEMLSEYNITLNVIGDDDWPGWTKGHFDPSSWEISVPERIYHAACEGERDALFVMLHEFGHLFLMHRPLLHAATSPPTMEEDSEWQADTFAYAILKRMGYLTEQCSFDFYM